MQPPAKHEQITGGIFLLLIGWKSWLKFSLIGTSVEARASNATIKPINTDAIHRNKNSSEPMQPAAKQGKTHTHVRAKSRVAWFYFLLADEMAEEFVNLSQG